METSLLLYLTPEWVLPLDEADEGKEKKTKNRSLKAGVVLGGTTLVAGNGRYRYR